MLARGPRGTVSVVIPIPRRPHALCDEFSAAMKSGTLRVSTRARQTKPPIQPNQPGRLRQRAPFLSVVPSPLIRSRFRLADGPMPVNGSGVLLSSHEAELRLPRRKRVGLGPQSIRDTGPLDPFSSTSTWAISGQITTHRRIPTRRAPNPTSIFSAIHSRLLLAQVPIDLLMQKVIS